MFESRDVLDECEEYETRKPWHLILISPPFQQSHLHKAVLAPCTYSQCTGIPQNLEVLAAQQPAMRQW